MEFRQLATFRMVAETLSFSRTAQALNYVQSSVTAQIQSLEEELGVRLFDRLGKRVALTDAGTRLLPYAEKLLSLSDEARCVVTGGDAPVGTLTITAPESICTYCLPEVLSQFRQRFPQVKLLFRPNSFLDIRRVVSEGEVDVAFIIEEFMHSNALKVEALTPAPLHLLVSPDHHLARCGQVRTSDLEGEQFLLTEAGCAYRNALERTLNAAGVHISTNLAFDSVEAIKQCAIAAMGIAFLPAMTVARELESGSLVALNWENQQFGAVIQMLWHKDKWLSPALQAFLAVARDVLRPQESLLPLTH
ncbi:MAG TPA: LysR family transcriptional regulator [Ktedonobacteraceae bacterium]|nr:LysR family transcriptional regulator [Ktedonobacteraceae bacterium]